MSVMSVEGHQDNNYADASQRFLLVMIWKLTKNVKEEVNGVTISEILNAKPSQFKDKYQKMLEAFGDQTTVGGADGNEKKYSEFFPDTDFYEAKSKLSYLDLCIATANSIFIENSNTLRDDYLKDPQQSPIKLLYDILNLKRHLGKNSYICFPVGCLFSIGPFEAQLTGNIPKIDGLIQSQLDNIDNVERIQLDKKLGRLSRSPLLVERVIGHISCFVFFGSCGALSFTAFNAALDFTTPALMLPSLSYGANLAVGALSGVISISLFVLALFRILSNKEKQNELQKRMKAANNPFEKLWLRACGAHETKIIEEQLLNDDVLGK
jgi:hypothetical protein